MGCSSSVPESGSGQKTRPQASVKPYPSQQQAKPVQQSHSNGAQLSHQPQQPACQNQQQAAGAAPAKSNFAYDYDEEQTEIAVKEIKPNKELLQKYIDVDNELRALEAKNIQKRLADLKAENLAVKESIVQLEKEHADAKAKTQKEKGEYDDVFTMWSTSYDTSQGEESDPNLMKEKKEWIEAKGEEEVAKKELDAVKEKLANNEANIKAHSQSVDQLTMKHKEQEELLAAIFKGKYGSDHENKLEAEHDFMDDKKQRVGAARYKWTNGRNLLQHAASQLCVACKKWMELPSMNPQDQKGRYTVATEARNNIIAASQNITSAKRYLSSIQFPYCKPEEIKVLEAAAAHVYTDMQSPQRHQYVYANVYHSMYKRSKALVDWFTHVLTGTIDEDLKEASSAAGAKAQELRQERLNLISIKIKEELHQDVQFEARATAIEEDNMSMAEDNAQVFQAEGSSGEDNSGDEPPAGEMEAEVPFNPVPLNELVQAPNKEDLFGDAQELYKRHQENMEELEKNQMVNKTRQEQGLEEKLKARRSRRQRQAAIAAELEVQQAAE